MKKALLLSVMIASVVIPTMASKEKNPRVGLRKTLKRVAIFNLCYLFLILYVWHRL